MKIVLIFVKCLDYLVENTNVQKLHQMAEFVHQKKSSEQQNESMKVMQNAMETFYKNGVIMLELSFMKMSLFEPVLYID